MTLEKINENYKHLNVFEKRQVSENYIDIVFFNEQLSEWNQVFSSIFGNAIKFTGIEPDKKALDLTEEFGGIQKEQTLYYKKFDDSSVIAMFWPWQNGLYTTLKITKI